MALAHDDDLETGSEGELRLGALGVVLDRADATAVRDADDDRHLDLALAAEVQLGDLADDLVVRGVDEAVELDLEHRAVAAHRQADRGAEDALLRQRRVDDPALAEVLLQPVGDAEDAAESADVLTHDHDLLVGLHGRAQSGVQAFGEGHLGHAGVPSASRLSLNRDVLGLLLEQLGGRAVDVDLVEQRLEVGLRQRLAGLAQVLAELLGLDLEVVEELLRACPARWR